MSQDIQGRDGAAGRDGAGPRNGAVPAFDKVLNLRDLGGLPAVDGRRIRPGRLFRSAHLSDATPADAARLSGFGLRTVVDFRNAADLALEGEDVTLPGVRHVNLPLSDAADGAEFWKVVREGGPAELRTHLSGGRAEARMAAGYRKYVLERTAEHRRFLGLLEAADGVPALWHCSVGKDRAGWSTAIVLLALGIEPDAVEADYLATNGAYRNVQFRAEGPTADPEVRALLAPLFEARLPYLRAAMDAAAERYGSLDGYLADGLAFGPDRQAALRDALLE